MTCLARRTWKRDGTHNFMSLEDAVLNCHSRQDHRRIKLTEKQIKSMLLGGDQVSTPFAVFDLPGYDVPEDYRNDR